MRASHPPGPALQCILASIYLSGCSAAATPLIAGQIHITENRRQAGQVNLSVEQLQAMTVWWEQHRSGWHTNFASASSGAAVLGFSLRHADDRLDRGTIKSNPDGSYYVEFRTGPGGCGHWPNESFCDLKRTRWLTLSVTETDVAAIRKIVDPNAASLLPSP